MNHSVTVTHSQSLHPKEIVQVLIEAEFEVDSFRVTGAEHLGMKDTTFERAAGSDAGSGLEDIAGRLRDSLVGDKKHTGAKHLENCELCRSEAACQEKMCEEAGKSGCTVTATPSFTDLTMPPKPPNPEATPREAAQSPANEDQGLYEATISIGGMTCAACSNSVTDIIEALPFVRSVSVNLMGGCGTVIFDSNLSGGEKSGADKIVSEVEDAGFECSLEDLRSLDAKKAVGTEEVAMREVSLKIDGMFCGHCPDTIIDVLGSAFPELIIEVPPTRASPIVYIKYYPNPPSLTLRHIVAAISSASPNFTVSVYHPPTMEERARKMQLRERNRILIRLIFCVLIAIPTFLLGIVWMMLVPKDNPIRLYIEKPMWAGQATRVEWALFILSTPVMFWVADIFHKRAIHEIRALWRKGSNVPILRRFYRFGSMNLLISLGVSISYFSSIALLAMSAAKPKGQSQHTVMEGMHMVQEPKGVDHITTYFDSTVLLTMFLLMGKSSLLWSSAAEYC